MGFIVFPAPRGAWQAPKISPRGLRNASGKKKLDCFVRFAGVPGSPRVSSQKVHGGSEVVREGLRRSGEGWRRSEKVRKGQRKSEKVRESVRKYEKL